MKKKIVRKSKHKILKKYKVSRDNLIPILQEIQKEKGYISESAVKEIADYLDISENDIYGVATFYTQFRFEQPGEHIVKVCLGTACHVRGGKRILDEVSKYLGIKAGETTGDFSFSLERVACFGSCALSPVVVIDGKVYGRMNPQKVKQILERVKRRVG